MINFRNNLEAFFEDKKTLLDKKISELLEEHVEANAIDVSKYIVEGGKRLRGLLTLFITDVLVNDYNRAVRAAVALELVHSCSLAIDDIIDQDVKRRGRPSVWVAKGISKTVLVSNLLIPIAIKEVSYLGTSAVKKVIETWLKVTMGEIYDVFDESSSYLKTIEYKTSSLFQLSLDLAAIASNREDLINVFERYGLYLGYLYQISDDLVDAKKYIENKNEEKPLFLIKMLNWLGASNLISWEELKLMVFKKLNEFYNSAITAINGINDKDLTLILKELPIYIVDKILEEGNLKWNLVE
ncbi:polyprenyl synthetase family protein [Fervidicoccus sp.]|uniref:polyprenyl synthetase family protein n=1 Tax=Fervidicoccus sp. TaxID=2060324 RepID=UPI003D11D75F